eukprot:14060731-Alexandrium_andersonii.AAC.1
MLSHACCRSRVPGMSSRMHSSSPKQAWLNKPPSGENPMASASGGSVGPAPPVSSRLRYQGN